MYLFFNILALFYKKLQSQIYIIKAEVNFMKKYNLIIVGGGISAVAAAVSAARRDLSVLIIEKFGCLGGALSNSLVYPFMRHSARGTKRNLSAGIFSEIKKRHADYGDTSWETFKFVFDDMIEENGIDVLFHSTVFKAETEGRNIKSVSVATKQGVLQFEADFFIDASGDGELIYMTGCDIQLGREKDNLCQPMTTCFRMNGVDVKLFKEEQPALNELYKKKRAEGEIKNPRENILAFAGLGDDILHLNTTRIVKHNPVDAFEVSKAEMLARKQIFEIFDFLKTNAKSCENASIIYIASHIGVRESRKLKGEYILTGDDIKKMVKFEDTIAVAAYDIDIHSPDGTGTTYYVFKDGNYYYIPYRSLLPKEYDNLMVAGRCLSADHVAHSAVRIMPTCACMGEAAGMAVALALESEKNAHTIDIDTLRQELKKAGAVID